MIGPELVFMCMTAAIAFTIFYLIKSRHEETMAKIEHGIIEKSRASSSKFILNLGIFLCFTGGGIATAYAVSEYTKIPDSIAFPACLFVAGGIGLITSFFINNGANRG